MQLKEVFTKEQSRSEMVDYRTIRLIPEGTFYRAYEWSAWLCHRYVSQFKPTHRLLKNTEDIAVLMVWLGDKLANMRAIYRDFLTEGIGMWQRFNQKDVNEQAWYYRSIAELTKALSDTSAWLEYKTLTELVFGKGE